MCNYTCIYTLYIYIHMYRTGDKKVSHMKRHHHICVAFCRWCQVEAEEENQRRVKFRWSFVSSNRKMLHSLVNQHRCGEAISS